VPPFGVQVGGKQLTQVESAAAEKEIKHINIVLKTVLFILPPFYWFYFIALTLS